MPIRISPICSVPRPHCFLNMPAHTTGCSTEHGISQPPVGELGRKLKDNFEKLREDVLENLFWPYEKSKNILRYPHSSITSLNGIFEKIAII